LLVFCDDYADITYFFIEFLWHIFYGHELLIIIILLFRVTLWMIYG
jgi:hypothetical protein